MQRYGWMPSKTIRVSEQAVEILNERGRTADSYADVLDRELERLERLEEIVGDEVDAPLNDQRTEKGDQS